jgi:diguanylate cyclase (GGDEF)-like protein
VTQDASFAALMRRPGVFSITWSATVLVSLGLLGWALGWSQWTEYRWPLLVVLAGAVLFETWPLTVLRHGSSDSVMNPYTIHLGQTFGLATLYVWGLQPAIVVTAVSWLVGQLLQRRPWWRAVFNAAQFVVCVTVAAGVMNLLGGAPLGMGNVFTADDLTWVVATWLAYFFINDVLVALLYESDGSTFWRDLTEETGWFVATETLVDTLSIVAVVLISVGVLYPLALVIPMVLFAQTYNLTRLAEHQSLHDELTELANRRQLFARLEELVDRGSTYSVVIVDLDGFKAVNDTHGHRAGDAVLVQTAARLRSVVRDHDIVARPSGDEFAVLLRDRPSEEESIEVARRLYRAIAQPVQYEHHLLEIGASVGVVTVARNEHLEVDEVLHRADLAMYQAKESGGGVRQWSAETPGTPRTLEAAG